MADNDRGHDDDLTAMTGGDRGLAKLARAALQRLRDQAASEEMREIARDVLDGRLTLRQAAQHDAYAQAFTQPLQALARWRDEIGEQAYQQHLNQAQQSLDQINKNLREQAAAGHDS